MKLSLLLTLFFASMFCKSQCPDGSGLHFTNQDQIDQFYIDYPNCSEYYNVTFYSNPQGNEMPITNINGIRNIQRIYGSLRIHTCPDLTTLDGLNNLQLVGVDLEIFDTGISSIDNVFINLTTVGEDIVIHYNDNLTYINDFLNLESLKSLDIIHNQLISINGFNSIQILNKNLHIQELLMESIAGFENLERINGRLHIERFIDFGNPNFDGEFAITAFKNLEYVKEQFRILNTQKITSLDWMQNLNSINQLTLSEIGNELVSLNGMENIDPTSLNYMNITGNENLTDCSLPNICSYLLNNGLSHIGQNKDGCNSKQQILDKCDMGTVNEELKNEIIIFPNPVKNKLFINSPSSIENLQLFSIDGKFVANLNLINNYIEISDYPNGDYILVIATKKNIISKKITLLNN